MLITLALPANTNTLGECIAAYKTGALDRAEILCTKATIEDVKSFDANHWLCKTYLSKGEFNKMLPVAKKLEELAMTLKEYSQACSLQALAYSYLADKKNELNYILKALEAAKKWGDRDTIGVSLSNLGEYYRRNNNLDETQKYLTEALEYETKKLSVANTYNSLGVLYCQKGDTKKAIKYTQKAMQYAKEGGDLARHADYSVGLAAIYIGLQDYANAKPLLDSALQIARDRGAKHVEVYALKWLGAWYENQGYKVSAKGYYYQALEMATAIGHTSEIVDIKKVLY